MVAGLSLFAFTTLHVVLSLVAIAAGFLVLGGLLGSRVPGWLTAFFLLTTGLTSATGFLFPVPGLLPSHVVGVVSLVVLAVAVVALVLARMTRAAIWGPVYVVAATLALWLNVFVGVVQTFTKVPALQALAPTQSEPVFLLAQAGGLLGFVLLAGLAVMRARRA